MASLFDIGVETGDLSEFTATAVDGGDLSVNSSTPIAGSYDMKFVLDDTNELYGRKDASSGARLRIGIRIDINSLSMANGDRFRFVRILQDGGSYSQIIFIDLKYTSGNGYEFILTGQHDSGSAAISQSVYIEDGVHTVEIDCISAANDSSNDGVYTVYVDGNQEGQVTNADNYHFLLDYNWRCYATANGVDAGTSGTFYMDDFRANDDGSALFESSSADSKFFLMF